VVVKQVGNRFDADDVENIELREQRIAFGEILFVDIRQRT
jgi:hypothetical protein